MIDLGNLNISFTSFLFISKNDKQIMMMYPFFLSFYPSVKMPFSFT